MLAGEDKNSYYNPMPTRKNLFTIAIIASLSLVLGCQAGLSNNPFQDEEDESSVTEDLTNVLALAMAGGLGLPPGVVPVTGFDVSRYLGTWYEIARLDHSFERGLSKVTAEYSLRDDGGLNVTNRGYSQANNEWEQRTGKAYFAGSPDEGYLHVAFFEPFYGSYAIFELDKENYQYAFVSGNTTSYLWLLSKTPTVSQQLKDSFVQSAKSLGFDTDALIYVSQE